MNNAMLSVILLSYHSNERIVHCYDNLSKLLKDEKIPFELIIMDDGSTDGSFQIAQEMESKYSNVLAYQLSKNFTSHYSIFAGLSVCNGQCAIPVPDDEQLPYDSIVSMYRLWQKGEKIIIPHRVKRDDPFISKMLARSFYKLMNRLSDIGFPEGGADSFFIDREIIDILNSKIHVINTSSISEVLRLGFAPYYFPYHRPLGTTQKSRWSFRKKVKLAKDFFFSSSSFPIKFITACGLFFSMLSLVLIIILIILKILNLEYSFGIFNSNVQGWTSLIVAISFFSGLILFSLGIIAEYILRIYDEVKARPGYIIRNKN